MPTYAGLIFSGGPVYTADAGGRRMVPATAPDGQPATAVAVGGSRIAAVGTAGDARISELAGPQTQVVDLRGRALLPGFQDAHVHPAFAGITMIGCNLIGATSLAVLGPAMTALAVVLIMFVAVTHQVVERESVVTRDEVQARLRALSRFLV